MVECLFRMGESLGSIPSTTNQNETQNMIIYDIMRKKVHPNDGMGA